MSSLSDKIHICETLKLLKIEFKTLSLKFEFYRNINIIQGQHVLLERIKWLH